MEVLKTYSLDTETPIFIQKITLKQVCVILDEKTVVNFNLKTGKSRRMSGIISSKRILNFLKFNNVEEWDGGWKPKFNRNGVLVNKMRDLKQFSEPNKYDDWFSSQNVKLIRV